MKRSAPTLFALTACALLSCSDNATPPGGPNNYTLRGTTPFPTSLAVGDAVRNLVIRVETRAGMSTRETRCGYSLVLFDVTRASTQMALATGTSGDCRLYMAPPENDYAAQQQLCVGGINVESGALMQVSGFCPPAGATPPWEGDFRMCGGLYESRSATVSSGDEIGPDDHVTDLMGTVLLPSEPIVTQPTNFSVTTWPATGDVVVTWTSANATSAVVRVDPDTSTRTGPVIVCRPRVNGTVRIEASLIDRAGLRTQNARVHVWSYREALTQAEGHNWNLVGAMGTSLLLQPGR